ALDIIRRHRLAERFLTDVLEFPWDRVDALAHRLEHALPAEVIQGFARILDNPTTCPHGYPIPDAEGNVAHLHDFLLQEAKEDQDDVITRQDAEYPEITLLRAELCMKQGWQFAGY